ncbi:uncharacterized protein KY384_009181 [Bacidia gigantensis]|uniref:uncharacterized protein n=1 Tax=Bacidia gigantensis TaxID=2732470 RepID=UPI001D03A394|nr:uncharacterized protein KY384_009181 [Bacidia gigantensis]KAG8525537.1 hypothetical protein KY384_009181 [Bacidia gigantensis]
MASSSQPSSSNPVVTFFGTCPTCWEQLDSSQRDSCIAQTHLLRLVEGHYAWIATGELAKQWNENGYQEYSAVIEHGRYRIGKPGLGRDRIASHELRLLSTSSNRESATPFVIVTSRNLRKAQETISRLQKHPRLCKFGFQYMARQGGLRLTAGEPPSTSNIPSVAQHSLCGARIAVYSHTGVSRGSNKNVSTIGGVFRIRQKYYALTAAHVFFENIASTGSWADSGLYVTTESSVGGTQSAPQPEISGLYEILVEGLWPYAASADGRAQDPGRSLGLFEPQVAHRRKSPNPRASIEVIWNFESDWALIQLNGPDVCGANALQISPERMLDLKPPSQNLDPPDGTVLIAAGVSGQVLGNGLGTVGGVMLPWSSQETQAWSTETEIGKPEHPEMSFG